MIHALTQTPRALIFSLILGYAANACADQETDQFVKKCHVYRSESSSQDFGNRLRKEKQKLLAFAVPIKLMLGKCGSLHIRIALPNGKFTYIETEYPKIEDPDAKGNQYFWDPKSPSDDYWLFRFHAWEWAGWRLVHKKTGRSIETVNECADAPISVGSGFISTLCSGNYENLVPTLYVADIRNTKIRWSGGSPFDDCKEHSTVQLEEMRFVQITRLRVRGFCPGSASYPARSANRTFTISKDGVSQNQSGNPPIAEWK